MAFLEIKNISRSFAGKKILDDISLSVEQHSFVSLLGHSGCGKTTLLRIIAGLETAESGSILLAGKDITRLPVQERNIGIVFQNYALFPHMNVFENVAFGLKLQKKDPPAIQTKVAEVLEKVKLSAMSKKNVSFLSGGEQQRVALARAIATEPQLLLLDEPLSNLDHALRIQARNELKRLQKETGISFVYVTHDQSEALALSDHVSVMDAGRIRQTGTPEEIYYRPRDLFTAGFIGRYNLFDQKKTAQYFKTDIGEQAVAAILPEHLILSAMPGADLYIKDILFNGPLTEYILTEGKSEYHAVVLSEQAGALNTGTTVSLSAKPENIKTIRL